MKIVIRKQYGYVEWNEHNYIQFYNYLEKGYRYWGYKEEWYDGPLHSFGFWFFNVAWRF